MTVYGTASGSTCLACGHTTSAPCSSACNPKSSTNPPVTPAASACAGSSRPPT